MNTIEIAKKCGAINPKGVYPNAFLFYPSQLEEFKSECARVALLKAAAELYEFAVDSHAPVRDLPSDILDELRRIASTYTTNIKLTE